MKVVILAGGLGTRLAEETEVKPKPMVEIGERPILWHIMKHYAHHGFDEFIIALGYKGEAIKRFFLDHSTLHGSLSIDVASGRVIARQEAPEHWTVHLVETGLESSTGGRIGRVRSYIGEERFKPVQLQAFGLRAKASCSPMKNNSHRVSRMYLIGKNYGFGRCMGLFQIGPTTAPECENVCT